VTIGRLLAWGTVAFLALVPVNWFKLWLAHELPADSTFSGFFIGTLICWGIAGGLGYFLIVSQRGRTRMQAAKAQAIQELMARPLIEIKPSHALLKAGEKAYASAQAVLHELKTVGYKAGSRGISVRVAKGVTLRSGSIRGHAVKGDIAVASGELVVTDQRVIFAGDRKSFVIPMAKLVNVTNYSDGFAFHEDKSNHVVEVQNDTDRTKFSVALQKVIHGAA